MTRTTRAYSAEALTGRRGQRRVAASFSRDGVLRLSALFDLDLLSAVHRRFTERYGGLSEFELAAVGSRVGHERYMISVHWTPPFDDVRLWAHPTLERLLTALLGPSFVLSSYALVVAYPGAQDQHVHMDHHLLFEGPTLSRALPPYAVTVAIPLLDLGPSTGGTRVWPGSHRRLPGFVARRTGGEVLYPSAGDAYVMDYRLLHGGTRNPGALARPVLYLAYSRPWFKDAANFADHPPVRISRQAWSALPDPYRRRLAITWPPA